MGGRLIKQPNGLFAWFSTGSDLFEEHGMTEAEAFAFCRDRDGHACADYHLKRAKEDANPWVVAWTPHVSTGPTCVYCGVARSGDDLGRECDRRAQAIGNPADGLRRWRDALEELRSPELSEALAWGNAAVAPEKLPPPDGVALIAAERARQIARGYDADNDDEHDDQEMATVAAWLAGPNIEIHWVPAWGRNLEAKHRDNRVATLTIAGALIAAELDRLRRVADEVSDG